MKYAKVSSVALVGLAVIGLASMRENNTGLKVKAPADTFGFSSSTLTPQLVPPMVGYGPDLDYLVAIAEYERIISQSLLEKMAREEYERIAAETALYLATPVATATVRSAATVRPVEETQARVVTSSSGSPSQPASPTSLDSALAASSWPAETWAHVKRIIACESGGQTTAENGPHYGLMQQNVNLHGHPGYDMVSQLNAGYGVYLKQGWGAWSCR